MFSYWEQHSFLQYDYIVVGAGITGLSAAISLNEAEPSTSILVLERGIIPCGASTRNAGFACTGSFTELLDDLDNMTEEEVCNLVAMRRDGLHLLRTRLGDEAIGYCERGSYELIGEAELASLDQLSYMNRLLEPVFNGDAFELANEQLDRSGFNACALIRNLHEGELHTGKMMRALTGKAAAHHIRIVTGAEVTCWEEEQDHVKVWVNDPFSGGTIAFNAGMLLVCNNAFAGALLPGIDLQPGRGQIILTEPVPGLPFKGIYHFDKGYYYFRELEGRILFGGGRNKDLQGEATAECGLSDIIQHDLEEKLQTIILPGRPVRVAQRWSGIMAFGATRQPLVQRYSPRVLAGVRMGGMGIAIGSIVGQQLAEMARAEG